MGNISLTNLAQLFEDFSRLESGESLPPAAPPSGTEGQTSAPDASGFNSDGFDLGQAQGASDSDLGTDHGEPSAEPSNALPAFFQNANAQNANAAPDAAPAKASTPPAGDKCVRQNTATDCGAAAVTTLVRETGKEAGHSNAQLMNGLDGRFAKGNGATPKEMSDMLAHEGFQVTRGADKLDQGALDNALGKGDKAVALVDSNKINPNGGKGNGELHWVVVDGKNKDGSYQIKDPAMGTEYSVDTNRLRDAMSSAWSEHKSGGMLVVHNVGAAATPETESARAEEAAKHIDVLGVNGGIGSNVRNYNGGEV